MRFLGVFGGRVLEPTCTGPAARNLFLWRCSLSFAVSAYTVDRDPRVRFDREPRECEPPTPASASPVRRLSTELSLCVPRVHGNAPGSLRSRGSELRRDFRLPLSGSAR